MSIKGIVLAVVSALAGATLIAFGGYYAGRHRKNVQLQSEINSLSNEKKNVQAYNDKLLIKVRDLEKQNKDLNEKDNVKKVKELGEKIQELNKTLENREKEWTLKFEQLEAEKIISEGEEELKKIEKYFNSELTSKEDEEKVHEAICNIFYREFDPQDPCVIFKAVNFGMPRTTEYEELKERQDDLRIRFERCRKECKQPMLLLIMVAICNINMQEYFADIAKNQSVLDERK